MVRRFGRVAVVAGSVIVALVVGGCRSKREEVRAAAPDASPRPAPAAVPGDADGLYVYADVRIDAAPTPARYAAPLPASLADDDAFAAGGERFPPPAHARDQLCAGDPAMEARLVAANAGAGADAPRLLARWRERLASCGGPRFCARARGLLAGPAGPLRDVVALPFARWCDVRDPAVAALLDRDDTPDVAVLELCNRTLDTPRVTPRAIAAATRVLTTVADGDDGEGSWVAIRVLAAAKDRAATDALLAFHASLPSRTDLPASQRELLADDVAYALVGHHDRRAAALGRAICARERAAGNDPSPCRPDAAGHDHEAHDPAPATLAELGRRRAAAQALAARLVAAGLVDAAPADLEALLDPEGGAPGARDVLALAGRASSFDAETGMFPNEHDGLLRELAPLAGGALAGAVFAERAPRRHDDDDAPYELHAWWKGRHYVTRAQNLGDWYDVEAVLGLLNAMLRDGGQPWRFLALATDDQIAHVVAGRAPALAKAALDGTLRTGAGDAARGRGRAAEDRVFEELSADGGEVRRDVLVPAR